MDYEDANRIVKEVDLEKILMSKGVSEEHINFIKTRKLNQTPFFNDYYVAADNENITKLVPTKKIGGIHRASARNSIIDNAMGKCKSELNVYRMATAISKIQENSLDELYEWYEKGCDPVRLVHYTDDDTYHVSGDGNHRSLYALTIGAPVIQAKVRLYIIDNQKKRNYDFFEYLKEKYHIVALWESNRWFNATVITEFKYEDRSYFVKGYLYKEDTDAQKEEINLGNFEKQLEIDYRVLSKWYFNKDSRFSKFAIILMKFFYKKYDTQSLDRVMQHCNGRFLETNMKNENLVWIK